jgi:alkyl hydroperoxide reductase subunit AhpC
VLIDRAQIVATAYGACDPVTGAPRRATVLLDADGCVLAIPPVSSSVDDLVRLLEAATAGVTPAL